MWLSLFPLSGKTFSSLFIQLYTRNGIELYIDRPVRPNERQNHFGATPSIGHGWGHAGRHRPNFGHTTDHPDTQSSFPKVSNAGNYRNKY